VILSNVEFYDDDEYLDPDRIGLDFKRQIVKFKYFDGSLVGSLGLETFPPTSADEFRPIASDATEYSKQRRKKRRGQQFFRSRLMEAYGGKCAVTGESHERVLEATHIEPYINISSNHIQNGMLLRVDIHRLMDEGLLALDNDLKLLVSSKLDSSSYVAYRGVQINLPSTAAQKPSTHAVTMHREERFQE
jgi:putative restriction endonuclease